MHVREAIHETDPVKLDELLKKLGKYEETTDRLEYEIAAYLNKVAETGEMSEESSRRIRAMYKIIGELESLGDSAEAIGRILKRKQTHKKEFDSVMLADIDEMLTLVDNAIDSMTENIQAGYMVIKNIENAFYAEQAINECRNKLREKHIASIETSGYDYLCGTYFMDIISELEKALELNPKFIYITPTFHNPAGLTYSRKRREEFLAVMAKHPDTVILEDDAYCQLYYDEDVRSEIVPMKTYAKNEQQIVYCSSFSKIFGPGLRIGWMVIPNEMYEAAEICKQSIDACTPQLSQMLAYEFMRSGRMTRYVERLRKVYKERRDTMVRCMKEYCPEVTFVTPKGGFFLWAKLPDGLDIDKYFDACAERGVVFVKGQAFSANYENNGHIRVSFSNIPPEVIEKGVKLMGEELKKMLK